jgi:hypothetical protein
LRLLKVAARVVENATRIRVAFASGCADPNGSGLSLLRSGPHPPSPGDNAAEPEPRPSISQVY